MEKLKKHISFVPQLNTSNGLIWKITNRSNKEILVEFEHPLNSSEDLTLIIKPGKVLSQLDITNEVDYGWITSARNKLYINSNAPKDTLIVSLEEEQEENEK